MSFLEQFLKESSMRRTASADSEEGDIEDNRAPSVLSSNKSGSDLSPMQQMHSATSVVSSFENRTMERSMIQGTNLELHAQGHLVASSRSREWNRLRPPVRPTAAAKYECYASVARLAIQWQQLQLLAHVTVGQHLVVAFQVASISCSHLLVAAQVQPLYFAHGRIVSARSRLRSVRFRLSHFLQGKSPTTLSAAHRSK